MMKNTPEPGKTTQNQSKQAETSRKDLKATKTTPKNWQNNPKQPKILKLGKSDIFYKLLFSNFEPKCPNLGIVGQEESTF